MGVSVRDFISGQEENGRRSKLEPFKSDILLLKQKGFSQNEKQELILFKDKIKNNLSENNLAYIKENTKDSYRNRYILEKLQNIDFTKINIFVSEPSYTNEYPSSLLALNMNEDTYYFDLIFTYDSQNKKWLIFDLKERG